MNSKVGNNRKYRLQRINDLHHSIEMERNYLPENFSVGGFSTGSTNQNAHEPLGVATQGWQPGMKKTNLVVLPIEDSFGSSPNWTFYKETAKKTFKQESNKFSSSVGNAYQKFQSFSTTQKASLGAIALTGIAARFLLDRQEESDTKISKKINTF